MATTLPPPYTPPAALLSQLRGRGYAVLSPAAVATLCGVELAALHALRPGWDDLVEDHYLKDGGRYRRRRHSCFVVEDRKSVVEGQSVSVRVDLGGRRIIKKKQT